MLQVEIDDVDACVVEATVGMFEQMLDVTPEPGPVGPVTGGFGSFVTIGAPQPLKIYLVLPPEIASRAARVVFALGQKAPNDADRQDVVSEMTNILAGSIKGMFDDATSLSLPTDFLSDAFTVPPGARGYGFGLEADRFGVWCEVLAG